MNVKVCTCGFANREDADVCLACGAPLAPETEEAQPAPAPEKPAPQPVREPAFTSESAAPKEAPNRTLDSCVTLTNAITHDQTPIQIPVPGGIIGRAGDFDPHIFSRRVSGVHASITFEQGSWFITFLGRNRSYLLRGDIWTELPKGHKIELLDGDQLRLADMLFSVGIAYGSDAFSQPEESNDNPYTKTTTNTTLAWFITCPVCGARYEVSSGEKRIAECSICLDPLDKRKIAHMTASPHIVATETGEPNTAPTAAPAES